MLESVRGFIEERAVKGLGMGELQEVSGLSAKTLTAQYAAAFGIKPLDEALHLRIAEAKRLLEENGLPITEIAARCGFSSQAGFYNYFKRHTGISPSDFRDAATPS